MAATAGPGAALTLFIRIRAGCRARPRRSLPSPLLDVHANVNPTAGHRLTDVPVRKFHRCLGRAASPCWTDDERRYGASGSPLLEPPLRSLTRGGEEEREIRVDYYKGLPRITIPLPSRDEQCRFTLKPISNTVGHLAAMIKEEDRGIDRVVLRTKDGVRISSSCSIEVLLEEEQFRLCVNDKTYRICAPAAAKKSFTKDDVDKLADIRVLIAQLYESLNVKEYHVHKEQELLSKMEKIQTSLDPLEEQRKLLEKKAGLRTSVLTWVGLSMMSVQFGILARLTWWEYSWDIMEPVTYFVTYGTAMATYAYFALTKQDYILPDVRDRQHLITLHKKACKVGFDLNQYNTLKEQLANVKMDLERLRDPLIPPHTASKISLYTSANAADHFSNEHGQQTALDNAKNFVTLLIGKFRKS